MSQLKHIQIGILSPDKVSRDFVAKSLGKKGQTSDIALYTLGSQEILQTTIVPEGYPNKPLSLIITAHMSDIVILGASAHGVDAGVGEAALLADCLGLQGITAVMGEDSTGRSLFLDQMNKVFSKLNVSKWSGHVMSNNKEIAEARKNLLSIYIAPRGSSDDPLAIEVDHAFAVKGVGSVILGTVISGTVTKGQKIKVHPEGQTGTVRSVQVNDQDANTAGPGIHVGLAMKGILPKYLYRGTVITDLDETLIYETNEIKDVAIKQSVFSQNPSEGDTIHVVAGLFSSPGKITQWGDKISFQTDKPIPVHPSMRFTLVDLNKKPSIIGSFVLNEN